MFTIFTGENMHDRGQQGLEMFFTVVELIVKAEVNGG